MPFNTIFKQLRQNKNLTQEDIAKSLKVGKSTISMWENGNREPNFEMLEAIADYFNVNMDILLDRKPTPTAHNVPYSPEPNLPQLNARDERDVQKKLAAMLNDLADEQGLAYYNGGEPMSDEQKEIMRVSLENSIRLAKQMAKQKFTPKKYRKPKE